MSDRYFFSSERAATIRVGSLLDYSRGVIIPKYRRVARVPMDVSNLLSQEPSNSTSTELVPYQPQAHQYPTRHATASYVRTTPVGALMPAPPATNGGDQPEQAIVQNGSPASQVASAKLVLFELLFPEAPEYRARLPMRVNIFPHDTTESIITTVRNFYGLYDGPGGVRGVIFEDQQGTTLIAQYENFQPGMTVYVRAVRDSPIMYSATTTSTTTASTPVPFGSASPSLSRLRHVDNGERLALPPPHAVSHGAHLSRPASRAVRKRSASPYPTGSDGDAGSATGSKRIKVEQVASAEISLDNIVQGGRRKRAKFESSELPLFAPPQVPMTVPTPPSVSPANPSIRSLAPSALAPTNHSGFTYPQTFQSPPSRGSAEASSYHVTPFGSSMTMSPVNQHEHYLRSRPLSSHPSTRGPSAATPMGAKPGPGVLPTPDPTVSSCISDEDVAIQLMRLGDASNLSHTTRHSTSTVDDSMSGAADIASSIDASSDGETRGNASQPMPRVDSSPIPPPGTSRRQYKHLDEILPSSDSTDPSADEEGPRHVASVTETAVAAGSNAHGALDMEAAHLRAMKSAVTTKANQPTSAAPATKRRASHHGAMSGVKGGKVQKSRPAAQPKSRAKVPAPRTPMSPASLPAHSRKPSATSAINFHHALREDEEDLSSKPRCQRCRKSKKGCDRQRPCQRCKDAGIGIEGCISEDETNGRKGRFGRHMGVTVKKGSLVPLPLPASPGPAPAPAVLAAAAPSIVASATPVKAEEGVAPIPPSAALPALVAPVPPASAAAADSTKKRGGG